MGGLAPLAQGWCKVMATPADSKVSCKYGAPMGRGGSLLAGTKTHLARVRLDSGGYDPGGAYWGIGQPLFVAWDDEGGEIYLRASSREAAKAQLRAESCDPENLRFYR